jgi:hypothetical protein
VEACIDLSCLRATARLLSRSSIVDGRTTGGASGFRGYLGGAVGTLTSKPAMTASMSGASSAAFSAYPVTVNWIK